MRLIKYILYIAPILMLSCSKNSDNNSYPKTFKFSHSSITDEQGYVFGENEMNVEINSKAGNLDSLRFYVTNDLYFYIRNRMFGYYVESFTLLSKDSIQIKAWEDGQSTMYIQPANAENPNGEIMDKNDFGTTILYDKTNGEIKFCIALALGIFENNGLPYFDLDYELCLATNIDGELQNFISYNDYKKNDTLGIYMMEMVYKE